MGETQTPPCWLLTCNLPHRDFPSGTLALEEPVPAYALVSHHTTAQLNNTTYFIAQEVHMSLRSKSTVALGQDL